MSKYGVFSGVYFPVFELNTGNTDQKNSHFHTVDCQLKKIVYLTFYQYSQLDGSVSITKSSLARFILAY